MPMPTAQNPNRRYVPTVAGLAGAAIVATALGVQGEGLRHYAYDDARPHYVLKPGDKIVGTLTNCIGHTDKAGGEPIVIGRYYSDDECKAIYQHDRKAAVATVVAMAPELYINPPTAGAAEDFVLNVGAANFATSSIRKDFNAGRIEQGCKRLFDWKYGRVKGVSVVINGLLNRRNSEYQQCVKGLES